MFITFEGPEGSGKTTQMNRLAAWLRERGYDVLTTREPGGTAIGDRVRAILLDPVATEMEAETEALLFSAARAQHVRQVILPHLRRRPLGVVLCDRFADSTLAYQGYGHGLDLAQLAVITAFATGGLKPDLTIYLDLDVEVGLRRKALAAGQDAAQWNRMEQRALDYHRRVRDGYRAMAAAEPQRWLVVDAAQPLEEVQAQIRQGLAPRLPALDRSPVAGGR
ncbi:MAG: dTMP kinase [Caldilineales bacterium]|nr:dTMP kinase [Caldilineales bacterium]